MFDDEQARAYLEGYVAEERGGLRGGALIVIGALAFLSVVAGVTLALMG